MIDLSFLLTVLTAARDILLDSSVYILFGLAVGGVLKMFLSTGYVARHLGRGRFSSVFKAALFGIPIPLCSCGVLPAAAALKKQGANNGATAAFLISTPESGVDSIAISYALLDPIMTVARPLVAFFTALFAGLAENFFKPPPTPRSPATPLPIANACPADNGCAGVDSPLEAHKMPLSPGARLRAGIGYAVGELWADLAAWFFLGVALAGLVTALLPAEFFSAHLGGGLGSMLIMLAVGVPLYICATASTPIAAAFITKGVSPGAALVFLLAGPATNMATLTVLVGVLGKRATAIYLAAIAMVSVAGGLLLDLIYFRLGVSAVATVGQAAEIIPASVKLTATILLLLISIKPLWRSLQAWLHKAGGPKGGACGCSGTDCAPPTGRRPTPPRVDQKK